MTRSVAESEFVLPDYALHVLWVLEAAGYQAWVVGGWVRDALLGGSVHDVDVSTSARWQDAKRVLLEAGIAVHETGTAHGTITAVCKGFPVQVTTYRVEGVYSDHRRPDAVRFVSDVRQDLARRDFTINAMAYHPKRGLLDPFGGRQDLARGLIRAVGEPKARFNEDALRVLRAVRFACRYGFDVEARTQEALVASAPDLSYVAQERIGQEMAGIVGSGHLDWALLAETDALSAAIPEIAPMVGFDQRSPYHAYDVLEHTAHVCRGVEEFEGGEVTIALRWAALLHDIGKPATFSTDETGRGHFFGHPKVGAKMAKKILHRLAQPTELIHDVCALVRLHDHVVKPTARSLRHTLQRVESFSPGRAVPLTWQLIDLKRADAVSKVPKAADYAIELDEVASVLRQELAEHCVWRVCDLAIDGHDVIASGVKPGPAVGLALTSLLKAVIDGELPNERAALLEQLGKR